MGLLESKLHKPQRLRCGLVKAYKDSERRENTKMIKACYKQFATILLASIKCA
jgi:hypothetical protein